MNLAFIWADLNSETSLQVRRKRCRVLPHSLSSDLFFLSSPFYRSTYSRTTSTTSQMSRVYPSDSHLRGRRRSSSTGSLTGSTKVRPRLLLPHHSDGKMCRKVFFRQLGCSRRGKKKKMEKDARETQLGKLRRQSFKQTHRREYLTFPGTDRRPH